MEGCSCMIKKLKNDKALFQVAVYIILVAIFLIENNINLGGHRIYSKLDDLIPFLPAFITIYCLWYFYIAGTTIIFLLKSKMDLRKTCFSMNVCMAVALLVYFIYPNYISIRPTAYGSDIFSQAVKLLQTGDSPSSVCPSLHVAVCISLYTGIASSAYFKNKRGIKFAALILAILISISTVFIKQHSIIDVLFGALLGVASYAFVYKFYFNEKLFPNHVLETDKNLSYETADSQ